MTTRTRTIKLAALKFLHSAHCSMAFETNLDSAHIWQLGTLGQGYSCNLASFQTQNQMNKHRTIYAHLNEFRIFHQLGKPCKKGDGPMIFTVQITFWILGVTSWETLSSAFGRQPISASSHASIILRRQVCLCACQDLPETPLLKNTFYSMNRKRMQEVPDADGTRSRYCF